MTTTGSAAAVGSGGAVSPASGAGGGRVRCEGVTFTVTEGNEVAEVVSGGAAPRVLGSESFFDASTGTRHHFVDVQGETEAMVFLVSVREDQRRIVDVRRFSYTISNKGPKRRPKPKMGLR